MTVTQLDEDITSGTELDELEQWLLADVMDGIGDRRPSLETVPGLIFGRGEEI